MKTIAHRCLSLCALVALAGGCGTARDLNAYRSDTQSLLETRVADVKICYDAALKGDAKVGGKVTVQFVVEKESGKISHAAIDPAQSTAPNELGQCVLRAIEGLRLEPGDRNEGRATFVYDFNPAPPAS